MNYETGIAEVQYYGDEFDADEAIVYAKRSYPDLKGEILYNVAPDEVYGYKNPGVVGII